MRYARQLATFMLFMLAGATALAGDKTAGEHLDDTWIHTKVKSELVGYDAHDINVEVRQGEVLLAGFVDSEAAKRGAVETASGIQGVTDVIDHLYVHDQVRMAGTTLDDNVIAGQIKAELASNERTDAFDINVEVRDGKVLLSGFVDSSEHATAAIELAERMDGVRDVLNGLEIAHS